MNMTSLIQSLPGRRRRTWLVLVMAVVLATGLTSTPTASVQLFVSVPIGGVIDWWRPNNTSPVPIGFQICDGSLVTDPFSPLVGKNLPDLRGRFVRGVTAIESIGEIGGEESHDHMVDLPAHTHSGSTSTAGNHTHSATTNSAGSHTHSGTTGNAGIHEHTWVRWDGSSWISGGNQFIGDISFSPCTGPSQCSGFTVVHSPLEREGGAINLDTNFAGTHNHSVNIASAGSHNHSLTTAAAGNHSHPLSITPHDPAAVASSPEQHLPPYVGLLKIMRIR